MRSDDTMAALAADLEQLRATVTQQQDALAQQRAVIEQQQAAINALQHNAAAPSAANVETIEALGSATTLRGRAGARTARQGATAATDGASATGKRGKLGRRGLLLGAAGVAGATVATAAVVAMSDPQAALAAPLEPKGADGPLATGDTLFLGENNDADAITFLFNTTNTTPGELLDVELTETGGTAIFAGVFDTPAAAAKSRKSLHRSTVQPGSGSGGPGFSIGVFGLAGSASGIGVAGVGTIDLAAQVGRIWQSPYTLAGPPSGPGFFQGESVRDGNGDLWLCTSIDLDGNSVWERVGVVAPSYTGGAISYLIHPIRLLDTRGIGDANQDNGGHACTSSAPTPVQVAGVTYDNGSGPVSVPSNAIAAIGNVTAVQGSGNGYLALVPSGAGFQKTSNVNYVGGQIIPNFFTVGLSPSNALTNPGCFDIIVGGASVNVLVDLVAFVV